jgi:Na+/proline symporter
VEFAELRYSGRPAAILRGFRALYLALPINCAIMGWVNLAMAKVLLVMLGWDRMTAVLISLGVTGVYVAVSGLWGVVVTDAFQFVLAMLATTAVAWFALQQPSVGGIEGLRAKIPESAFSFFPTIGESDPGGTLAMGISFATFITFIGVQWWASWYPGAEPGGGGYVAQRMMSAKDERHSLLATLWFTVAHYCVRPWPWILVGLATVILYPAVTDREASYVMVIRDHLPAGWRGLLLAGFFAAYMSTIATQLNWGSSYLINDFYRRFVRTSESETHYVTASRVATLIIMVVGAIVTFYLDNIRQAWEFILESGAGIGLVLILRWYWWRVNAWSEIAAMTAPAVGFAYLKMFTTIAFPYTLLYLVVWTTFWWLLVTLVTRPEPDVHLVAFYRRVRPGGPGWSRIARAAGGPAPEPIAGLLLEWVAGTLMVYAALFGVGTLLLDSFAASLPWFAAAAAAIAVIYWSLARRGWSTLVD